LKDLRMYEEIAPEAARPLFANSLMPSSKETDVAALELRARA
jgi:hypothetical protein